MLFLLTCRFIETCIRWPFTSCKSEYTLAIKMFATKLTVALCVSALCFHRAQIKSFRGHCPACIPCFVLVIVLRRDTQACKCIKDVGKQPARRNFNADNGDLNFVCKHNFLNHPQQTSTQKNAAILPPFLRCCDWYSYTWQYTRPLPSEH